MATLSQFNEIFKGRGVEAAIAYAIASKEPTLLWAAGKAKKGEWELDRPAKTQAKPAQPKVVAEPTKPAQEVAVQIVPEISAAERAARRAIADKKKAERRARDTERTHATKGKSGGTAQPGSTKAKGKGKGKK